MKRKLNCMCRYNNTETKHLQVLYLKKKLNLAYEVIADIVGYAVSTVKRYYQKYYEKINEALELFFCPEKNNDVVWECEKGKNNIHSAYVCEIYNNYTRLFLKIGYSSKVVSRMRAHINNISYGGNRVVVKAVYYFDSEEQALSMENLLRKYYRDKNNDCDFIRRDRFTEQIPTQEDLEFFKEKAEFIREYF